LGLKNPLNTNKGRKRVPRGGGKYFKKEMIAGGRRISKKEIKGREKKRSPIVHQEEYPLQGKKKTLMEKKKKGWGRGGPFKKDRSRILCNMKKTGPRVRKGSHGEMSVIEGKS